VQGALKSSSGYTVAAAYYFYMRCEEHPNIDMHFSQRLEPHLLGDSETMGDLETMLGLASAGKRKSPTNNDGYLDMMDHSRDIVSIMRENQQERNKQAKRRDEINERKENRSDFLARLEVAKALNDKVLLTKMLGELEESKSKKDSWFSVGLLYSFFSFMTP
jgi:hypothetical protein